MSNEYAHPQKQLSHRHEKAKTMKKFLSSFLAVGVLAAAALGLPATASSAPAGPSSIDVTVDELRAQGFDVVVSRIGDGPQEQCTLGSVRPGHEYSRTVSGIPGEPGDALESVVLSKTVYVDVLC
jgi:hypothetical protein